MNEIEKNLYLVNDRIKKSCKIYNKNIDKINLVAVSKKFSSDKIITAINANCKIFGENYVSEACEKWPEIKEQFPQVKLHFIGAVQSKQIKKIVGLFDVIQSLDSEKAAQIFQKEINKRKEQNSNFLAPEFFIQVNIGQESQKSGIDPIELKNFVEFAKNECDLNISGLMAIPPNNEAPAPYFALMNKLALENNLKNLSMGMSADFEEAIALNANYIRVGTAIFGQRKS